MDYADDYTRQIAEFVKREPWLAMGGAFIIGYVAAQLLRGGSRR